MIFSCMVSRLLSTLLNNPGGTGGRAVADASKCNNRRKVWSVEQANARSLKTTEGHETVSNRTRVIGSITDQGRSEQTSSCTSSKNLFDAVRFFSNPSWETRSPPPLSFLFFFYLPFPSPNLPDFPYPECRKVAGIVFQFFPLSRSYGYRTLASALSHCCLDCWSTGVQGDRLTPLSFPVAVGRLTGGGGGGGAGATRRHEGFTGSRRSGDTVGESRSVRGRVEGLKDVAWMREVAPKAPARQFRNWCSLVFF